MPELHNPLGLAVGDRVVGISGASAGTEGVIDMLDRELAQRRSARLATDDGRSIWVQISNLKRAPAGSEP